MRALRPIRTLNGPVLAAVLLALLAAGCQGSLPGPPPSAPSAAVPAFAGVDRLLEDFRERGAFPGGVLAVGHRGALVHLRPFGRLTYDADAPPVTAGTLYDLASLTKVVATTTMAMILVDEGRLDLDRPVRELLPGFQGPGKETVTVRHLLTHSSGLQAIAPLYKEVQGREAYRERVLALDLVYPAGSRSVYSDPGIILLGEILEQAAGQPVEAFVRERVFEPLGMRDTRFRPPAGLRPRIAPTEFDPWRGRLVHGEVHDENAFALGGVAPHAGLFGTAGDLARFAQMLLNGGVLDGRRIVSRETVEMFTRRAGIPGSDRALGWDTKSAEGSSAGSLLSARSFGHTGFTGTSIWIDPERQLFVVLLTNRVHPTRENNLIREVRPAVADAVARALGYAVSTGALYLDMTDAVRPPTAPCSSARRVTLHRLFVSPASKGRLAAGTSAYSNASWLDSRSTIRFRSWGGRLSGSSTV
jgi:CubicO group peptidase (beta-lactamase class C family)